MRVLAKTGVVEFVLEQLRSTADAAQGVLDLVHQVSDQLAIRVLLLDQALFPGGPELLIDRPQFDQQAGLRSIDRVYRTVQPQQLASGKAQVDILPGVVPAMVQGAVERRQEGRWALDDASHRATDEDLAADRQQILGGGIHVPDGQILVEQNDGRR